MEALAGTVDSDETARQMMSVFTGFPSVESAEGMMTPEKWHAQRDGLAALLAVVTRFLLEDGDLYNAVKHGLATVPAEVGFRIDLPDSAPKIDISMEGKALQYLRRLETENGRRWHKATAWIFAEANLTLTYLIAQQLESLMNVGRARYVSNEEGFRINPVTVEFVETAERAGWPDKPFGILAFAQSLAYWANGATGGPAASAASATGDADLK